MLVEEQRSAMHWIDYVSHHTVNIIIKNEVREQQLIIININPEKIVNSDVKYRSLWWIHKCFRGQNICALGDHM
jgi:hypothetical protein